MEIPEKDLSILYSVEWFIESLTRQLRGRQTPLSLSEMQGILSYGEKLLARYRVVLTGAGAPDNEVGRLIKILDSVLPISE